MKNISVFALILVLQGCAATTSPKSVSTTEAACIGSVELPSSIAASFDPVEDEALLSSSLGEPLQGNLCQGKVYQANKKVIIYRAWNSTNPNSKFGKWWAFDKPAGLIAQYREDYEICYQWSPLDKMVQCTLQAGEKVVVGTGQSAQCSQYLTYPVSAKQQVFISDSASAVLNCQEYDGVMEWK